MPAATATRPAIDLTANPKIFMRHSYPSGKVTDLADHHSAYLERAVAALTPEGTARVDELLAQLARSAQTHEWLVRFAGVRRGEADAHHASHLDLDPAEM